MEELFWEPLLWRAAGLRVVRLAAEHPMPDLCNPTKGVARLGWGLEEQQAHGPSIVSSSSALAGMATHGYKGASQAAMPHVLAPMPTSLPPHQLPSQHTYQHQQQAQYTHQNTHQNHQHTAAGGPSSLYQVTDTEPCPMPPPPARHISAGGLPVQLPPLDSLTLPPPLPNNSHHSGASKQGSPTTSSAEAPPQGPGVELHTLVHSMPRRRRSTMQARACSQDTLSSRYAWLPPACSPQVDTSPSTTSLPTTLPAVFQPGTTTLGDLGTFLLPQVGPHGVIAPPPPCLLMPWGVPAQSHLLPGNLETHVVSAHLSSSPQPPLLPPPATSPSHQQQQQPVCVLSCNEQLGAVDTPMEYCVQELGCQQPVSVTAYKLEQQQQQGGAGQQEQTNSDASSQHGFAPLRSCGSGSLDGTGAGYPAAMSAAAGAAH